MSLIKKDWIDIFTALLIPIIAFFGSIIAFQQWKINKTRINLELFDKKYLIFEATKNFLNAVLVDCSIEDKDRYTFLARTKGALFLYGPEIAKYLNMIHKNSLQLRLHERKNNHDESDKLTLWFSKQLDEIDEKFKDSLMVEA